MTTWSATGPLCLIERIVGELKEEITVGGFLEAGGSDQNRHHTRNLSRTLQVQLLEACADFFDADQSFLRGALGE